jgi:hypothetical protein
MLALGFTWAGIAASSVQVRMDSSQAPQAAPREQETRELIQEWYPKIRALLSVPADVPAFPAIDVVVRPAKKPAWAIRNTIYINPPALQSPDWKRTLIHELTHIVQDYRYDYKKRGEWVVEGIADYVAYGTGQGVLQPRLPLEADGYLRSTPRVRVHPKHGYKFGYYVGAAFLLWLEQHKNKEIVIELHRALMRGQYTPDLFRKLCGVNLEGLWTEFYGMHRAGAASARSD